MKTTIKTSVFSLVTICLLVLTQRSIAQSVSRVGGTLPNGYICSSSPTANYAVNTNGLNVTQYFWQISGGTINGSNTGSNVSVTWTSGGSLTCQLFINGAMYPSYSPSLSVSMVGAPSVSISGPSLICSSSPSGSFSSSVTNGIGSLSYQWYRNGSPISGATGSSLSTSLSQGDAITLNVWSSGWCGSSPTGSNTYTTNITTSVTPSLTITSSTAAACTGQTVTFTANISNAGTGSATYDWRLSGEPGSMGAGSTYSPSVTTNTGTPNAYSPGDVASVTVSNLSGTCLTTTSVNGNGPSLTIVNVPGPVTVFANVARCGPGAVTLTATYGSDADRVKWYTGGGGYTLSTSTYTTPSLSATTVYYASSYSTLTGCESGQSSASAIINPIPGLPSATGSNSFCGPGAVVLTASPGTNGTSVKWYALGGGAFPGTVNSGTQATTPSISSTTTYSMSSYNASTTCEGAQTSIVATINAIPSVPSAVTGGYSYGTGTVSLSASASPNTVAWYNALSGGSAQGTGNSFTTPSISQTTVFYAAARNTTTLCESSRLPVTATVRSLNAIIAQTVEIPNITTGSAVDALPIGSVTQNNSFVDGLGRGIETVNKGASPALNDINAPVVYDALGREKRKYLPFAAQQTGNFKPHENIIDPATGNYSGIAQTYATSTDNIADDTRPFAETMYEASPLNRVSKQGAPGLAWQPNSTNSYSATDNTIRKSYEVNSASEVLNWTFLYSYGNGSYPFGKIDAGTASSPVYYAASLLTKTRTKDESQNEVIEYVNSDGKTVLKRVQAVAGSVAINDTNYASTYYIYDDFLNLVCVIPPEATKRLATEFFQSGATDATKENFLRRWAFRYRYDARARMMLKQVPGADSVKMVYDLRDRLVLTQDGNQRSGATKYWTFTKYDVLNRPIMTGIRDTSVNCTQIQMQNAVNTHYAKSTLNQYETYVGSATGNVHGYSNKSYPARTGGATEIDQNKYLTITYYDNYNFRSLWTGTYTYLNESLSETVGSVTYSQPAVENMHLRGQATGTKTKVLDAGVTGGANWLKTVNYYDDKYRVIQTLSDNYKGGSDRISNVYDFTGKILKSKATHVEADVTWKDLVGAGLVGNSLTRTASGGTWGTSGAASYQTLPAGVDGWMELTVSVDGSKMIGFSDVNVDANYTTIDYALYLGGLTLYIYENGTMKYNSTTTLVPGEVLRINRTGTTITYLRNGTVFYTSLTSSATSLLVDNAILNQNATLTNVRTSFGSTSHVVTRRFVYDHAGRLLKVRHQLDANPEMVLVQNDYNEIGQLVDKKLHSTNNGSTFKQSVDMRYNIRGWLKTMNNSQLTNDSGVTNDDGNDLFGMELGYDNSIGTSNVGMFNGNISGMKWSTDLALGTVKDVGYNYSYDPMNRILGASYLKNTAGTWANATSAFSESGYSYDMNGNILGLTRKDVTGTSMDMLTYDYGTTVSNQLLKVSDTGDKTKGFIEPSSTTGNDYNYDANGNMTVDQNKGITAITYNYLNLPSQVTKGSNKINYYYDASGKKVSQLVTYTSFQKKSDYMGEYFYENDTLRFINTEEGRVIMSNPVAQDALVAAYMLDGNANDQSGNGLTGTLNGGAAATTNRNGETGKALLLDGTDDYVNIPNNAAFNFGSSNFTVSFWVKKLATTVNWDNGVGVCKWNTGSSPGTNSWSVGLGGQNDNLPGFAIESSSTTYQVNGTTSLNIGTWYFLQATRQGNLLKLYVNGVLEGVTTLPSATTVVNTTTLPVYVGRLPQGLYTNAVFDEIQIIHETTSNSGSPYEYQYNLKDHLGNVRLTFTTVNSTDQATGTLEDANLTTEQSKFLRYSDAKRVNSIIFDHTNGAATGYSERLNGTANEKYGIARSLSVMPGDTIKLEVYGKYVDSNTGNWTGAFTTLMGQISAGTAGVVVDGANYATSTSSFPFAGLINTSGSTGGPKAYLNWAVFDRDYNFISGQSGFTRMTATPSEHGQDVAHERMYSPNIVIAQPGYVYTWLSNEETSAVEVYFDDFKVTLGKGPVVQQDDYYPFGLRYNSFARENSVLNKTKLFQGQEHIDDLGLNWDSFKWRNHMPDIGRFFGVDPLSAKYYYNSPYAFSENKVVAHIELEGLESLPIAALQKEIAKVEGAVNTIVDNVKKVSSQIADWVGNNPSNENLEGIKTAADIGDLVTKEGGLPNSTIGKMGNIAEGVDLGRTLLDSDKSRGEKIGKVAETVFTKLMPAGEAFIIVAKDGMKPNGTTAPGKLVNSYRQNFHQMGAYYAMRIRANNENAERNKARNDSTVNASQNAIKPGQQKPTETNTTRNQQ